MRGYGTELTVGERVAWFRRQRGLSQEVVAGLVGRTGDWLGKVENGRAALDRLSVIGQLADVLDVTLGDLIGDPQLMGWSTDTRNQTVPALRKALLSYSTLLPVTDPGDPGAPDLAGITRDVADLWNAYQASRFGYVTARLPRVLRSVREATNGLDGRDHNAASAQLALTYQVAASTLTKVGENELAWICADRGLMAAEQSEDLTIVGSLLRSLAHALLSNSQYGDALAIIDSGVTRLSPTTGSATPQRLSMLGSLLLVAAMAAARTDDAPEARARLSLAEQYARRLGADSNYLWSAFGPTNVAIHRVSIAMEVGDVQIAADLGPQVDTAGLPVERRVRHALEVARAFTALNRPEEALAVLLTAERDAPEQVRYHYLSRELVLSWIRAGRAQPSPELRQLAERVRVA